jgi:hypothetical protein
MILSFAPFMPTASNHLYAIGLAAELTGETYILTPFALM